MRLIDRKVDIAIGENSKTWEDLLFAEEMQYIVGIILDNGIVAKLRKERGTGVRTVPLRKSLRVE